MATINYQFGDGHYEDIEVTEEIAAAYRGILRNDQRIARKARRRESSLEMLLEQEERQDNYGRLENECLKRKQERFSLVSSEPDPLEVLVRREEEENKPLVKALCKSLSLTDYQRTVAVEHYINNKPQAQIARELGVSPASVSKLIKKVQKKVLMKLV